MTRLFPAFAALLISTAPALAERVSVLVFDASGSMWNRVEGDLTRIEVARDVMGDYFGSRDGAVPLSVIAYGHNRRGDCGDIEVIAPMGRTAAGTLESRLRGLMPRGMTPLTDSLRLARQQVPATAEAADIILVTDGLETCEGDPCALAASLAAEGIDIRAHVVGFGLSAAEAAALSCITDQTGGMLFQTNSGAELAQALQQVSAAVPEPAAEPEAVPDTVPVFTNHFVFRDIGTGTPRGLMEWRAESPDGTVIPFGRTEGTLQSIEGLSTELPAGEWLIIAEGVEGRAERRMTLTQCCGSHGVPFTGTEMVAAIPPLGQVQAGMGARLPYEITHPGVGNLGGNPYQVMAVGPEGSLTSDQILRRDLITQRGPGIQGARTGELEPGTYRFIIAIARSDGYDIITERTFEAVDSPVIGIVAPDRATPGERIEVGFDGGYTTRDWIEVVDENDRRIGQGNALYRGPGSGSGGPVTMTLILPNREGTFDMVVRREGEILARRPITISATPAPEQGQDTLPTVPATFRLPADAPQSGVTWEAVPLDPDMTSGPWTPAQTGPAISGSFEPGNWRVTATAPGEVMLTADVAIFPGQANNFTLQVAAGGDEDGAVLRLDGDWQVLGVPPRDAPTGSPATPLEMMRVTLATRADANGLEGTFTPSALMVGPVAPQETGPLDDVTEEEGALTLRLSLPAVSPAPFVINLQPFADGYAGRMESGTNGLPVIFWPVDMPLPSLAEMQAELYGPEQEGSLQDDDPAPVTQSMGCDQPICQRASLEHGLEAQVPQGWMMWQVERVNGAVMAQFTNGSDVLILTGNAPWPAGQGPCLDTAAGPLCHWPDVSAEARIAAAFIASGIRVTEVAEAEARREVAFTIPGRTDDPFVELEVTLAAGEEPGVVPGQRIYAALGALSSVEGPFLPGNRYDFHTVIGDRAYRRKDVLIEPGAGRQPVTLFPVYLSYEVTLTLPDDPVIAGTGGYFPVTITAPDGFTGSFALHDADDRDAPPILIVDGQTLLTASDPVLPVPDRPGFYELRFLDAEGEMFGGAEFEALAAMRDGGLTVEPGDLRFAGYGPYLAGADVLVQVGRGVDDRRPGDRVVVLPATGDTPIGAPGDWLDDFRARVAMPGVPGQYRLAVLDADAGSLRALSLVEVAANPAPVFWRYNPNPRPDRPYGVVATGRMAMADRLAIVAPDGARVAEAGLHEALTGAMRLPLGTTGPHELVYMADGAVLARVALEVGGPPPLVPSGGSDGATELSLRGPVVPGGTVEVSLRGMIPMQGTVGFVQTGTPDLTILQTGSRVSPDVLSVAVDVPDGAGPWVLRLIDENRIRVAELRFGDSPVSLTTIRPGPGLSPEDVLNRLLPGFAEE